MRPACPALHIAGGRTGGAAAVCELTISKMETVKKKLKFTKRGVE